MNKQHAGIGKVSFAGLIITLGIVFGDLGTSPLYTMRAILNASTEYNEFLIFGALSCIFWTLTLQTTVKYVIITLRADNHGEGGIFALFALIKKKNNWVAIVTMIGGSALLADGVITPAITVTSAVEGLGLVHPHIPVVPLVITILSALFFFQQFGTGFMGKAFGPVMVVWFSMLAILGINFLIKDPRVLAAINPMYAVRFLSAFPNAVVMLGAVFLATTGAEALYSDLGHCGIKNIRISWIFVKTTLLFNYFGQGAYLINHLDTINNVNPFYVIMPSWFLIPGVIIATAASIIASQALISGSYTIISEAVSLNIWPWVRIIYPTNIKGQVYIPFINWFLWIACTFVVIYFGESSKMEAAYGLSITITMIMTTLLLSYHLWLRKVARAYIVLIPLVFLTIEGTFLYANLFKFANGGWLTIALAFGFFLVMYGWYFGRKIRNKYISFVNIKKDTDIFTELSNDTSVPKIATNLVYISKANRVNQIESKIMYSIFNKHPKRANTYWFLHVDSLEMPNTFEYVVHHIIPGKLIKVEFRLGFKIERKINLYFREVIEDLVKTGEISMVSQYESLKAHSIPADFLYVNLERILTNDYKLPPRQSFIMGIYNFTRRVCLTDVKALGLDSSCVIEEKVPIIIEQNLKERIVRIQKK
ncbi:MAG: KUP/HAK/KT family potassium transporter [Mariniphaga sp.]